MIKEEAWVVVVNVKLAVVRKEPLDVIKELLDVRKEHDKSTK
jgi:hypothetical protein